MNRMRVPEGCRVKDGPLGSTSDVGTNGLFFVPSSSSAGWILVCICSDGSEPEGQGWQHVSVQAVNRRDGHSRIPSWREMCQVKNEFWDADVCCFQLHPPAAEYVNNHPSVLHLWHHPNKPVPRPPIQLI